MSEDLQSLLEKINRDGIEKANAESARIIETAKQKAAAIVKEAEASAEKAKADAEKTSADYAARAAETVAQSARDTILKIESAVTAMLEQLLIRDVDAALANPDTAAKLATEAIKDLTGPGEITCGSKLAAALKAQLADKKSFTLAMDDALGTGFTVKVDGGRVKHAFTGAAIAEELAKRLRPDLAKLVK